jgi:hypothetical protein
LAVFWTRNSARTSPRPCAGHDFARQGSCPSTPDVAVELGHHAVDVRGLTTQWSWPDALGDPVAAVQRINRRGRRWRSRRNSSARSRRCCQPDRNFRLQCRTNRRRCKGNRGGSCLGCQLHAVGPRFFPKGVIGWLSPRCGMRNKCAQASGSPAPWKIDLAAGKGRRQRPGCRPNARLVQKIGIGLRPFYVRCFQLEERQTAGRAEELCVRGHNPNSGVQDTEKIFAARVGDHIICGSALGVKVLSTNRPIRDVWLLGHSPRNTREKDQERGDQSHQRASGGEVEENNTIWFIEDIGPPSRRG